MTEHRQLLDIPDPLTSSQHAPPPMPALPAVKSPTRAERKRSLTFVIAAAVVYQFAWLAFVEHRADLSRTSLTLLVLAVIVPLVLSVIAFNAAVGRGARGLGVSVVGLGTAIIATPVLFALASLVMASRITDETAPFLDRAIRCIAVACALSAPPMIMLGWVFRHAFVAASSWRSAALGVACGALGAATMSLACSHGEALHVIVAHGSMMVIGGGLGALLGRTIARA
jgi:hypothetical protein